MLLLVIHASILNTLNHKVNAVGREGALGYKLLHPDLFRASLVAERCVMVHIRGRVQGVGFRYYTRLKAQDLGIRGWVKNLPDGRVQSCICGDARQLKAMQHWLAHGPVGSRVESVEYSDVELADEIEGFRIL